MTDIRARPERPGRAFTAHSPPTAMPTSLSHLLVPCLAPLATACLSLDYDLSGVPMPISAKPSEPGAAEAVPFRVEARQQLFLDGLFGRSTPDVAALVTEAGQGYDRIARFQVKQTTNIHQWLLTHLTLSLWRMKTVVIEGELVRDRS